MDAGRRLRALLDERFAVVVATLVVLALAGGWVTYATHVSPGTTVERRPASSWQTTGWFNHSATVTENNSVYPAGTTLADRPVYFTEVSPRLDGTYSFAYRASDRGVLNGTVSLQFVLRGVDETGEGTVVVWQTTRPLRTVTVESLEPGERVRVPFSIDMNETANRTRAIEDQLGGPPGTPKLIVRATVDLRGSVGGRTVDRVEEHALPIGLQSGTYRPGRPGKMTERYETTRSVTVQRTYGPLRRIGAPALLLASLCALAGLVVGRRTGRLGLSEPERERLDYEDDREDFDEWIAPIRLPDEAFDLPRAEAASLEALVDFAIDTDNAVVEDPDAEAYYVCHDGYLYTYRPPPRSGEGGLAVATDSVDEEPTRAGDDPFEPASVDGSSETERA